MVDMKMAFTIFRRCEGLYRAILEIKMPLKPQERHVDRVLETDS